MTNVRDMRDRVALVTGAATGIGRETALAFARRGAAVAAVDVDERRVQETAALIRSELDGRAIGIRADVAREDDVRRMVEQTVSELGSLDFAVNNAGIEGTPAPAAECSNENWERTIGINLTGVWYCMKHELRAMLERGGGAIVNVSSVAGLQGFANLPAYVASKHGVVGLTKAAALDYARRGIRVNVVCPGVIDTEMIHRFTGDQDAARDALLSMEPVRRMGTPAEVADSIVWLCSPGAGFVTGAALAVDGGLTAG